MDSHDIPMAEWIGVTDLARAEGTTRRQVYWSIDRGMPHSRIGDRIRVRRADWHRWHERHLRGAVADAETLRTPGGR